MSKNIIDGINFLNTQIEFGKKILKDIPHENIRNNSQLSELVSRFYNEGLKTQQNLDKIKNVYKEMQNISTTTRELIDSNKQTIIPILNEIQNIDKKYFAKNLFENVAKEISSKNNK